NLIDDNDLRRAESRIGERVQNLVMQRLHTLAGQDDGDALEIIQFTGTHPALDSEIQAAFPEITNLTYTIRVVRFPDHILYRSLQEFYREYISRLSAALNPAAGSGAQDRMTMNIRLDELQRYGELLTQFPILLEFLALERGFPPQ
ncbi:MAG: hypothetical protein FWD91_08145, partial [Treponema sp.]|nr:hypothetical protein [Treponema sp.]